MQTMTDDVNSSAYAFDIFLCAGAEVTVASVEPQLQVKMSRGVQLVADVLISECRGQSYDAVALPVGTHSLDWNIRTSALTCCTF